MSLFDSPSIHTSLSCYSLDHGSLLTHICLALGRCRCYIGVADKLLYRGAIEDPQVLVGFGLERRRVMYSNNQLVKSRDFVPHLAWYGS